MVTYTTGTIFSALSLAYRLYGDASRAGALAAENQTFNPAFMQMTGRALSA
jgi:prophage DNA circulation protein